ncbi:MULTISPECIES: hypothetical protein [unclassified Bradyrhizobium]|uniref:hypothetical protein n=1 Tax=unclassified Bradyrhizobium TaxID=2631580 RepID=UPI0029169537|nr:MULTISPECIES: hypothetical protein [unclassified Bradyrhizobium]
MATVGGVTLPGEGMTLSAFGAALQVAPDRAEKAARYLHRKRLVFVSKIAGHVRILPADTERRRGRPSRGVPAKPKLDPRFVGLLSRAHPIFLSMKEMRRDMPTNWRDRPELRAALAEQIAAECDRIMKLCRRFMVANGTHIAGLREALWLDQPDIMPLVAERHPALALGVLGAASSPVVDSQAKRLSKGLSAQDRVLVYVRQAGRNGITVADVSYNFGGRVKRAVLDDIVATLESVGQVIAVECRSASRGRIGVRLFDPVHGEPVVLPDGRLVVAE